LLQSVVRDTAAEVVDVVHPDIGGEPTQDAWEIVMGAAMQRRIVKGVAAGALKG